jgi:formamidopyrimidine-DNA glycosylase
MPELPEVETVRQTLLLKIKDQEIKAVDIRYSNIIKMDDIIFKNRCINQTITDIKRSGKYLIFVLNDDVLIIHLRMEGKFFIKYDEPYDKHEHVIFKFKSGMNLRYHDVRKFGTMHLLSKDDYEDHYPLNVIGNEPKDLDPNSFYQAIHASKRPIKAVLLDQHIISGLGNIYVDETLFLAKVHPQRLATKVSKKEAQMLIQSATAVLDKAVSLGGTTIRSYTSSLGVHGRFQNELNVHTRQGLPCPICGNEIIKIKVAGRGSYVCTKCQK